MTHRLIHPFTCLSLHGCRLLMPPGSVATWQLLSQPRCTPCSHPLRGATPLPSNLPWIPHPQPCGGLWGGGSAEVGARLLTQPPPLHLHLLACEDLLKTCFVSLFSNQNKL